MGTRGHHVQYHFHGRLAHLPIVILMGMGTEQVKVKEAMGDEMATKNEES